MQTRTHTHTHTTTTTTTTTQCIATITLYHIKYQRIICGRESPPTREDTKYTLGKRMGE